VEEGTAFCKHCGAPQIRVAIEPGASLPESNFGGTADARPPAPELPQSHPLPETHSKTFVPAAIAGVLEALFTLFALFGVGMLMGGFLSVALYRRRTVHAPVNLSTGARLGLISGAIGFGIFAVVWAVELLVLHTGPQMREAAMKSLEQTAARYPAEAQATLQYLQSPEAWPLIVALLTVFTLVAFLLLSTLGGVIGAAVLNRQNRY